MELVQNRFSGLSRRFLKVLEIMGLHRCRPVPAIARPLTYHNLFNLPTLIQKYTLLVQKKPPPAGIEPATFRLTAERANQLRHGGFYTTIYAILSNHKENNKISYITSSSRNCQFAEALQVKICQMRVTNILLDDDPNKGVPLCIYITYHKHLKSVSILYNIKQIVRANRTAY